MKQIRIHGRGGQGVVAMAEILAIAFFNNGQKSQAFPNFGVERSGAPIQSFVRFSDDDILLREHVYIPDILIILDASLIGKTDLFSGIKKDSQIIINSSLKSDELLAKFKQDSNFPKNFNRDNIFSCDASKIALEVFGKNIVNTAILGFLVKGPKLLKKEAVLKAISEKFLEKGKNIIKLNNLIVDKVINNK